MLHLFGQSSPIRGTVSLEERAAVGGLREFPKQRLHPTSFVPNATLIDASSGELRVQRRGQAMVEPKMQTEPSQWNGLHQVDVLVIVPALDQRF